MILPESPKDSLVYGVRYRPARNKHRNTVSKTPGERDRDRETEIDRNRETEAHRNIIKGHRERQKERHNLTLV